MALVSWPPASYPTWPPPEFPALWVEFSDLRALAAQMRFLGYTLANPTNAERNQFFRDARCDHGDTVAGRMIVSPDGTRRYPFAVCSDPAHRSLLVLWSPFHMGCLSGVE